MKNRQKDRYEKKLLRFMKEYDNLWEKAKDSNGFINIEKWRQLSDDLEKQYGMTEADRQRAYSLHRHHSDRHYWHDTQFYKGEQKQKAYDRAERNGSRAQYSDETLEAFYKAEQDWILDVYDWQ